jgi:hypothetical protein
MESRRCSKFVRDVIKNVEKTDTGIDGRIIFKWILEKWDGRAWTGLISLSVGTDGGPFECGNEPLDSIKFVESLDWFRTC